MLDAAQVLERLKTLGISHVVGIPDNSSAGLFKLLSDEPHPKMLTVTREGEAFAIATGLWMGGQNPAVLIQNTGMLESGDSLRGTATRMRIPLLCLVTYRGYGTLAVHRLDQPMVTLNEDLLSQADLDSVALVTEPTLKAWDLPYHLVEENADLDKISVAFSQASERSRPVVVLIAAGMK